jgi:hypothetical protein
MLDFSTKRRMGVDVALFVGALGLAFTELLAVPARAVGHAVVAVVVVACRHLFAG